MTFFHFSLSLFPSLYLLLFLFLLFLNALYSLCGSIEILSLSLYYRRSNVAFRNEKFLQCPISFVQLLHTCLHLQFGLQPSRSPRLSIKLSYMQDWVKQAWQVTSNAAVERLSLFVSCIDRSWAKNLYRYQSLADQPFPFDAVIRALSVAMIAASKLTKASLKTLNQSIESGMKLKLSYTAFSIFGGNLACGHEIRRVFINQ